MLASNGGLTRLVCATDQVRHNRVRDLTSGDAIAFTEIGTAQQQSPRRVASRLGQARPNCPRRGPR